MSDIGYSNIIKEKEDYMKFKVNENCVGCGFCTSHCPDIFEMTDEGLAKAKREAETENEISLATDAMENCPVNAIEKVV